MSIAQSYHERTKYDPQTLASQGGGLDWESQPEPFKQYPLGSSLDLRPYLEAAWGQDLAGGSVDPQSLLGRLSRLLYCSYGLTQRVATMQGALYLRAAPSAGGLYPAEVYLISGGVPGLAAGLYHYQPQRHALLRFWEADLWPRFTEVCLWHPSLESTRLALVVSAVFFRSAWRYRARAYRRIGLDLGHVLGNVELAGALTDFRPHLIGGFVDEALNQLFYLDAEREGAIAVLALADRLSVEQNLPPMPTALRSAPSLDNPGIPENDLLLSLHQASQISPEFGASLNWRLAPASPKRSPTEDPSELGGTHRPTPRPKRGLQDCSGLASAVDPEPEPPALEDKYNFPFCTRVPLGTGQSSPPAIDWGEDLGGLLETLIRRRSTRAYSGQGLSRSELSQILDFTYHSEHYYLQGFDQAPDYFALGWIETFVAVLSVDGLEEGCYYYAPQAQELRQIRFKQFRPEVHYLCLGQDLGRDAAAVVFHTADLAKAVDVLGDRAYRYLHLDAGHLGQRLNLAAIQLGLGVSGIGGFFDDQVNDVLGIPEAEAVLYITTLGRPA